jgi:hypothetical protein
LDHKNPIDNWLKQSFDQQVPPGSINRDDMAPLWDRVSQSLESKKKRFAYWWIFAAVAIGALITVGVIYTSSVSKYSKNELTTEVLNNESITENQTEVNEVENGEDIVTANNGIQKEEDFNPNPVVNPNLKDKDLSNNLQDVNNNTDLEAKSNKDIQKGSKPIVNKEMDSKGTIDNITNYVWFSSPIKPSVLYSPFAKKPLDNWVKYGFKS